MDPARNRAGPRPKPAPPKPVCQSNCGGVFDDNNPLLEITCPCGFGYYDKERHRFIPGSLVRGGNAPTREEYVAHVRSCEQRVEGAPILTPFSGQIFHGAKITAKSCTLKKGLIEKEVLEFYLNSILHKVVYIDEKPNEYTIYGIDSISPIDQQNIHDDSRAWTREAISTNDELLYEDSEVAKRRMESAGISTDQSSSPERDATLYEKNSSTRSDDGHGRIPSYSRLPNSSYRAALCRFPSDNLASSPPTTSASYGTPSFTSYNANPITRANPIFPGPAEPPRNVAITSVPTKYPLRERADSAISVPDADVDPGGAGSRLQVTSGSTSTRRQDRTYRDSRRSMSPEDKALQGQPQRPAAKSERYGGHPPRRPEPREDRGQKRPK